LTARNKHVQGREHSIQPSVMHTLNIQQVRHGVRCCVKNGSIMEWKSVDSMSEIFYSLNKH